MQRFEDRVAVITGAASGIGLALAHALAARGCHLALVDVDAAGLERARAALACGERRVTAHVADVADLARVRALSLEVASAHEDRIEIVINNAGVALDGLLREARDEDVDWIVGVNLLGVLHGCRVFLPWLERADEASLVNVSSLFGLVAVPTQSLYCMTKFAVRGLTQALQEEYDATALRVLLVHPGAVATDIMRRARYADASRNRERVVDYFDRHGLAPADAAAQIVDAMASGARRLVLGEPAQRADAAVRRDPDGGNRVVAQALVASLGLDGWQGALQAALRRGDDDAAG